VIPAIRALIVLSLVLVSAAPPAAQSRGADSFASRIAALSEPGGYFDTDNLISNERSYLHVVPALLQARTTGGAYIGVGPDQNFSYIAHVRPAVAILIDIRRDNLLLHLLFKALFELSATRVEYLANLTGRAPPPRPADWARATIDEIVAHVDRAPLLTPAERQPLQARIAAAVARTAVPLSAADRATIGRFHGRFIEAGLSLRFNSAGRPPQADYPTYRDLLLEVDRTGARRSVLAAEADYLFVKRLQADDLVIPVVGDLAGPKALAEIGTFFAARKLRVAALYTSNVEFYLFRQGSFDRFAANIARLPLAESGVIIRSAFGGAAPTERGYNSASLTQPLRAFVDAAASGRIRGYGGLLAASR
jgi:hypothetical protein